MTDKYRVKIALPPRETQQAIVAGIEAEKVVMDANRKFEQLKKKM